MKTFPIYYSPEGEGSSGGGSSEGAGSSAAPSTAQAGLSTQGQASTGTSSGASSAVFDVRQHVDDAGSFKGDWWKAAGVSENLGKKFTRPEALARSYEALESKISAKGIILPGPNATQQERDAFYQALGRPAKPEDYAFQKPDKIGDKPVPDIAWDSKRAQHWQQKLYEAGLSKDQANKVVQAALEESLMGQEMIQSAHQQAMAQSKAALQKEWGADYDRNLQAAARAAERFGGDELKNHPGLGNDPVMIKALAKIGLATEERPGVGTRQQAGETRVSPADAAAEAQRLTAEIAKRTRADRNWANSPEAQQLKARKSEMFKIAYPED